MHNLYRNHGRENRYCWPFNSRSFDTQLAALQPLLLIGAISSLRKKSLLYILMPLTIILQNFYFKKSRSYSGLAMKTYKSKG